MEGINFTAHMYRIKAFQPTDAYKQYLAKERENKKTRKQLGEDRAARLNKDKGWQELLGLFNKRLGTVQLIPVESEERNKRRIQESLEKLPEDVIFPKEEDKIFYNKLDQLLIYEGIMCEEDRDKLLSLSKEEKYTKAIGAIFEKAGDIFYDSENATIRFPKLKYKFYENEATLAILINPCIDESVRTKLITRPTLSYTLEEFKTSPKTVIEFFKDSKQMTDVLFTIIQDFYIKRTQTNDIKEVLSEYCKADIFVIGSPAFSEWVKFSMDNEANEMVKYADGNSEVSSGRNILKLLKDPGEEYKWFSRRRSGLAKGESIREDNKYSIVTGVYGIYGTGNYCKVLGVTDDQSGLITRDLASDIVSMVDSDAID